MRFEDAKAKMLARFQKHVFLGSPRAGLFANHVCFSHDIFSETWEHKQGKNIPSEEYPFQRMVQKLAKRTESELEKIGF